jgi:hypothetical protein
MYTVCFHLRFDIECIFLMFLVLSVIRLAGMCPHINNKQLNYYYYYYFIIIIIIIIIIISICRLDSVKSITLLFMLCFLQ